MGTTLIVLALPAYYFTWRYRFIDLYGGEAAVAGILARMILSLTAVKLVQKKSDRDWIFLYMMSFFEVLLAAGLSISAFIWLIVSGIPAGDGVRDHRVRDQENVAGG